jgi:hypothetical protein
VLTREGVRDRKTVACGPESVGVRARERRERAQRAGCQWGRSAAAALTSVTEVREEAADEREKERGGEGEGQQRRRWRQHGGVRGVSEGP